MNIIIFLVYYLRSPFMLLDSTINLHAQIKTQEHIHKQYLRALTQEHTQQNKIL